jgi:sortase B
VRKLFGNSKKSGNTKKKEHSLYRRYIPYICLVAVGAFLITSGARELISGLREDAQARDEYEMLRAGFEEIIAHRPTPAPPAEAASPPAPETENDDEDEDASERIERPLTLEELSRMNRDFIGWMSLRNLIEYPIVRGSDNDKYINTTFMGHRNTAGAIFMDYRNTEEFSEQVTTIYGHHTRDGMMFAPLVRFLDPGFLRRNSDIVITLPNGSTTTYTIFHATLTDAWDPAYTTAIWEPENAGEEFPNAPPNATRFMLLSTCTRGGSDDERILVFAAEVNQ